MNKTLPRIAAQTFLNSSSCKRVANISINVPQSPFIQHYRIVTNKKNIKSCSASNFDVNSKICFQVEKDVHRLKRLRLNNLIVKQLQSIFFYMN